MGWLESVVLGIVQGLTEFLPISSSAHLRILGAFMPNAQDPGAAFTAITQIGTEAAVVVFFWRDIVRIVVAWFKALFGRIPRNDPDARMGWLIIIGTIPVVILGILLQNWIETAFRSLWIVAGSLIVFGILLGIADRIGGKARGLKDLTYGHGIAFGIAQAFSLIPGVSRSGGTITMGRFLGYERAAATRYAFLLAVPAVFGSGFYELYKSLHDHTTMAYSWGQTGVATAIAFVVGLAVIAFLMRYISTRSFLPFVIWRILVGVVVIVLLALGVIQP